MRSELLELASHFPIVTIYGPRQSGKTTLCRETFVDKPYVNLESPEISSFAKTDPRAFLAQYPEGAILDEVQNVPDLLSYIQTIVDETQTQGMFILTGSHQPLLHQNVAQSLAGRTAILTLLPLSMTEISQDISIKNYFQLILSGGYPKLQTQDLQPLKFYQAYYQTYLQRDVKQLTQIKDLLQFKQFVMLCAGRIGSIFNANEIANEVGVSNKTIQHWVSILEASFVIFRLSPYYENFNKRTIKSPKIYFTDVGLASYILGITDITQLQRDRMKGHLFENLVILELMKHRYNQGLEPNLYFFRDSNGNEVDIIYQQGSELTPIEIKSSQTFHSDFIKSVEYFEKITKERCGKKFVIYAGDNQHSVHGTNILNYKNSTTVFE